ncbi:MULTISPECIES: GIY-YIG nuclease family protein [Sphingomonadales]|jgi:hypothetical protein|uniref:GIY-YIG nuclease family protein n=1 Tax=Sphingomonadales TaxID=204457 RepID=UPI00082582B7|nr:MULTISPECIES: GIY-YIG nuclease family protein [Sphingomonadales]
MLIQNYGLFWREDRVDWGAGSRRGKLLGYWNGGKWCEVDFREQSGIYVLYDSSYKIIYIGQAGHKNSRLFNRLKQHRKDHLAERWSIFSWFGTRPVDGSEKKGWFLGDEDFSTDLSSVLNHIEGILIAACEPPLNKQGGRFGDAERYLQRKPIQEEE